MNRNDLLINAVLFLAILGVTYLLVTFRPTELKPPSRFLSGELTSPTVVRTETNPIYVAMAPPLERYDTIQKADIFHTIITPTPIPPTPTPTPIPPPPIDQVMAPYALVLLDTNSVTLQNTQSKAMIEWKVKQKQKIKWQNQELEITLKSVDMNNFKATFTAPPNQTKVYSYF